MKLKPGIGSETGTVKITINRTGTVQETETMKEIRIRNWNRYSYITATLAIARIGDHIYSHKFHLQR